MRRDYDVPACGAENVKAGPALRSGIRADISVAFMSLTPKVRPVTVERSTLTTEAEVDAWLDRQKRALVAAIKDGPVLVS